ncbi:MAG: M23 family metallopeptidase [Bacillota bacterium]
MKKEYLGRKEKYWSVLVVPHSTNDVKVFKISSVRYKLLTLGTIALTFIICSGLLITYLLYENRMLNDKVAKISALNNQQVSLLNEKKEEISSLIKQKSNQNKLIEDFNTMYKDMTKKYIEGNMDRITVSRSGSRNDRSFINDINRLKSILDSLEKINKSEPGIVNDLTETEAKLKEYIDAVPTLWPTSGRISSTFGQRTDPLNFRQRKHEGIDIAASRGQSIKAAAIGKVVFSDWNGNYGKTVIIDHGYGLSTLYAHCSSLLVKEGQSVNKGDLIARVGNTGRSTGDHLHFEVRINNVAVDPLKYLDTK